MILAISHGVPSCRPGGHTASRSSLGDEMGDLTVSADGISSAARGGDHVRSPYRIGQILDWGFGVPPLRDQLDATQMAFDEATESGVLDRPVEVVTKLVEGLPYESFATLRDVYRELVEANCLGIIGPHITDQTVALREEVQRSRVPTLVNSGTLQFFGDYHFLTPTGTFADEAALMAGWLRAQGASDVTVLAEDNPLGDEYAEFFRPAARERQLRVATTHLVSTFPGADEVRSLVDATAKAESIAFMGFGVGAAPLFRALNRAARDGLQVPKVMSSIFMATTPGLGYGFEMGDFEGWAGVDQFHEDNEVYAHLYDRFELRFGRRPPLHPYLAMGFDLGNAMAHALALARTVTPSALRDAFERVRMLPAAIGGPGNVISFGPYDHRGYKGQYIVMRKIVDGRNVLA